MGMYVPPQYGQGGDNSQNLVQLAMAVKSFKMQEKEQKRQQAAERVSMLMKNPQLLLMQDPKEMEKDLKALGIKVTDQPAADPAAAKQTTTPKGDQGSSSAKVDPNQISALANATQGNKSGAQAASPASPGAANKAPGGG